MEFLKKFLSEGYGNDDDDGGDTPPQKIIDKKVRFAKKSVERMMKERRALKEVLALLDKASEDIDQDIAKVETMLKLAQESAKFQHGMEVDDFYNVEDDSQNQTSESKADEDQRDEDPAAHPPEQPNPASSSSEMEERLQEPQKSCPGSDDEAGAFRNAD